MKQITLTICLGVLLVGGCNKNYWFYSGKYDERLKLYMGKRADVSQEKNWVQFQSDCRRCETSTMRSSYKPFGTLVYMGTNQYAWADDQYGFESCMEGIGYRQVTGNSFTPTLKWKHGKRWSMFRQYEFYLNESGLEGVDTIN